MTKKLLSSILSICLLFSSLYLTAHAETANKTPAAKTSPQIKKSPEANFLDGDACLKQANTACAKLALANIPSTSAYAKLLQGSIALNEKQTDKALLLLLPLQTEENLIAEAKIALHELLANAFEELDDAQQAIQHLLQAEAIITASNIKDAPANIKIVHEKIWGQLKKLDQNALIELRGNNTDNIFQGWIDLRLANSHQDLSNSISGWLAIYPDHPAQTFAQNLSTAIVTQPALQASLTSEGSIALIMPLTTEANAAKADAFKLGLEVALTKHGLHNEVKTYPSTDNQQEIEEMYTLAKNEGNAYFIIPSFHNSEAATNQIKQTDTDNVIYLVPTLDDEALHIADFALKLGMQQITIITTDDDASKLMSASIQTAWQSSSTHTHSSGSINIITLPVNFSATDNSLFELKSQLAEKTPDMVLLAMPALEVRLVRPHLPISTPAMTFSSANEIFDNEASHHPLNAVRLFDIPYLLTAGQAPYKDYEAADADLDSNALLRWFALGVDSLQLLTAAQKLPDRELLITGLTGMLTVDNAGNIKRQLPLARFTHNGITVEQ